jgi:hypothetical protein
MALDNKSLAEALACMERGDWQKAHEIVLVDEDSPLACWAHGIAHLMEGDLPNARYWYREAKRVFPENPSVALEIRHLKEMLKGK